MAKGLHFRTVVGDHGRFAAWVNDLRNSSGVYVIRGAKNHVNLYVGESHSGRLAATIKRHFWSWGDREGREHFTADPARVQVAVRTMPPAAAIGHQERLIRRLNPRHNKIGRGAGAEEVPF